MWTDAWVGLPYAEFGRGPKVYDCLGLYLAVYHERFGVDLPDPMISRFGSARPATTGAALGDYHRVDAAREGDALLFTMAGRSMHVGYALNARDMLHLETDQARSCVERWNSTRWRGKLEGIYRYAR